MAGVSTLSKYMDAINAICLAYGGGNVVTPKQGYVRYTDSDNFDALILALNPVTPTAPPVSAVQGYFSYWVKDFEFIPLDIAPATIVGELAVYVPKDISTDMDAAIDFVADFGGALIDQANYNTAQLIRPRRVRCALHKIHTIESGGIAFFDFGNYGAGGIELLDP